MLHTITSSLAILLSGIGLFFSPDRVPDRPVPDNPPDDEGLVAGLTVPEGILMVINADRAYFTLLIQGEEVANVDQGGDALVFSVDERILQMNTTSADDFIEGDSEGLTDSAFAALHQQYEERYLTELVHENISPDLELNIDSETHRTPRGITYRLWQIQVDGFPTQVLASVALPPTVLVLSTAFTNETEKEAAIDLIRNTVESVERRHKPIDFEQVRDSIQTLYGEG